MKHFYLFILFMFFIILVPNKVDALCDYNEKARLKAIAANITFKTDHIESDGQVEFFITLSNLHPELYVKDVMGYKFHYYNASAKNPKELTIGGYSHGRTIQYEFYTKNAGCTNEVLLIRYVTLPPYNRFYNDPLCKGLESYTLCQKWVVNNLSYGNFKKQIEDYKNRPIVDPDDEDPGEKIDHFDMIANFLGKYYVYILMTIIIVCLISIYRINKKDSFDFS